MVGKSPLAILLTANDDNNDTTRNQPHAICPGIIVLIAWIYGALSIGLSKSCSLILVVAVELSSMSIAD